MRSRTQEHFKNAFQNQFVNIPPRQFLIALDIRNGESNILSCDCRKFSFSVKLHTNTIVFPIMRRDLYRVQIFSLLCHCYVHFQLILFLACFPPLVAVCNIVWPLLEKFLLEISCEYIFYFFLERLFL